MAILDNSLFGTVGGGDALQDQDGLSEFLRRLQELMNTQGTDQAGTMPLPGIALQNLPVNEPAENTKSDKGPATATTQQTSSPATDNPRFLESQSPNGGWQTDAEPTPADALQANKVQAPQSPQAPQPPQGGAAGPQTSSAPPQYGAQPQPQPTRMAQASTGTMSDASPDFSPSWQNRLSSFFYGLGGHYVDPNQPNPAEARQSMYQALVQNGVPAGMARAAISNPKLLEQLVSTRFGPKAQPAWIKLGTDIYGNDINGTYNAATGEVRQYDPATGQFRAPTTLGGAPGQPGQPGATGAGTVGAGQFGSGGAFPKLTDPNGNRVIGQSYIDQSGAPQVIADQAANIMKGHEKMPTASQRNKQAMLVNGLTRAAAPDYSNNWFDYREKWMNPNTKIGTTRVNNNTAIQHLFELSNMVADAPDHSFVPFNWAENRVNSAFTDSNSWINDWKSNVHTLAGEIVKVNTGAEGAASDRQAIEATMNPEQGKDSLNRVINKYIKLLAGKTNALAADWEQNASPYDDKPVVISKENQQLLSQMMKNYNIKPHDVPVVPAVGGETGSINVSNAPQRTGGAPAAPAQQQSAPAQQVAPVEGAQTERPRGMPAEPPANAPVLPDGSGRKYMMNPNFNAKLPDTQQNPRFWVFPQGK